MGFYSQIIFPRLLDWSMSAPEFSELRRQLLKQAKGQILEIGFGTGLNLAYYPSSVQTLTALDANPGMNAFAEKRIAASGIDVKHLIANGERLPLADQSFDTVVSTWTMCSIADIETALSEICRILKPSGELLFIEHGLSDDPNVQAWQDRLTPLQKVIADGCHLNRNIQRLLEKDFKHVKLKRFILSNAPAVLGYTYQGSAANH
jgi:ubiquinone/menaquinone biosynthesis C-methylase UbiE